MVFYHEMQLWANQGYFVFFCNPRGSDGHGDAYSAISAGKCPSGPCPRSRHRAVSTTRTHSEGLAHSWPQFQLPFPCGGECYAQLHTEGLRWIHMVSPGLSACLKQHPPLTYQYPLHSLQSEEGLQPSIRRNVRPHHPRVLCLSAQRQRRDGPGRIRAGRRGLPGMSAGWYLRQIPGGPSFYVCPRCSGPGTHRGRRCRCRQRSWQSPPAVRGRSCGSRARQAVISSM